MSRYKVVQTRHGPVSLRKGKTDRKRARRAERMVVRGKLRKNYPGAPSSREQAMKRPEKTPPPAPPPPAEPAAAEGGEAE